MLETRESAPRSRRAILVAAAGAAAATTAAALARPLQATAANGDPLILGQGNAANSTTQLEGRLEVRSSVPDDPALTVFDESPDGNAAIDGISISGTGVQGQTDSPTSPAMLGVAYHPQGVGVFASNAELGTGLSVYGKVKFGSRSGRATVAARRASVDIDLRPKGGLAGTPLCFANVTSYRPGVFVTMVRPNYPVAGKARIHLNRAVSANTFVAWLVLN